MANASSTWREHPLHLGARYVAREDFGAWPNGEFKTGRDYRLIRVAYSHYDSSSVFLFKEAHSQADISWWWHDDERDSLPIERFAPEPAPPPPVEPS